MKNVYSPSVLPYGKLIKEPVANNRSGSGISGLRIYAVVIISFSLLFFNTISLSAQNCATSGTTTLMANENTYYPGTQATVAAGATSITLGAIGSGTNFGNTPIASGDIVLIIQMQGAQFLLPAIATLSTYGGNNSPNGNGFITTNLVAGHMEFAVATSAVPVGGGTLTIASGLTYNYAYAPYSASTGQYTYQVIRIPSHFNIQLGATIVTPLWNGATGGVTVISAVNQLNFAGFGVNALGAGFRGGGGRSLSGSSTENKNDFYDLSTGTAQASKAEGIAGTPRYMYVNNALFNNTVEGYPGGSYARGAPGNAGGGASDSDPASNDQNAGGGGGGNGGTGGTGGNGWHSFGLTGGRGGTSFQTTGPTVNYYGPGRLIMGGGGGAGTTNNGSGTPGGGVASSGAAGGGLVIINALTIAGTGTINASSALPNNTVTVDGSGGGGAGGSILIYANSGQAGITATANGGNGGSNNPSASGATQHGPGGGGGGGVIYSNMALNAASTVTGGSAGVSTGDTATNTYGAFDGTPGVLTQTFPFSQLPPNMQICQTTVLPATIISFSATYVSANNVKVAWETTNEINASYYVVERSADAVNFSSVAQVGVSDSPNPIHSYAVNDQLYNVNSNIVYYRLRIVDNDGGFTYSETIPVKLDQPETSISVYPNPVDSYTILNLYADKQGTAMLRLMDESGKQILTKSFIVYNGNNSQVVDQLGNLPRGIYVIQVMFNNNFYNQKIIKK